MSAAPGITMRLKHHPEVQSIRVTDTVELAPGVSVRIQDLPPTYADELEERLPSPKPKAIGPLKDKGTLVRDPVTHRPMMQYDEMAPDYISAVQKRQTRSLVYYVLQGVSPGEMEFDATPPDSGTWEGYLDAVLSEMKAFGLGLGQVNRLVKAIMDLSGINDEDIDEATADFS